MDRNFDFYGRALKYHLERQFQHANISSSIKFRSDEKPSSFTNKSLYSGVQVLMAISFSLREERRHGNPRGRVSRALAHRDSCDSVYLNSHQILNTETDLVFFVAALSSTIQYK